MKYPAFVCASLAALPALMAPVMAEQEARSAAELCRTSISLLADAAEVLNSQDKSIDKAFKMSQLTLELNEVTEARRRASQGEWIPLVEACAQDEEMRNALRQFTEALEACTARGFEDSVELYAATGEFTQVLSRM